MIYAGTDLKFRITSLHEDLDLQKQDFSIVVKNRWGQIKFTVVKDDCFYDSDGNYYFTLEGVPLGVFYAYFSGGYKDEDYEKMYRTITDVQYLCTVISATSTAKCPCQLNPKDAECIEHAHCVKYEEISIVNQDGASYLADVNGNYIYTSDGKRIQFKDNIIIEEEVMPKIKLNMTGDEFKRLIEETSGDSKIDTLPEVFNFLKDVGDETFKEFVDAEVDAAVDKTQVKVVIDGNTARLVFPDGAVVQVNATEE